MIFRSTDFNFQSCTGFSWEGDTDVNTVRAEGSGGAQNEIGYFERLGAETETFLENMFTVWGTFFANHAWFTLLTGNFRNPNLLISCSS